jgi:hypothetical protein
MVMAGKVPGPGRNLRPGPVDQTDYQMPRAARIVSLSEPMVASTADGS